MYVEVTSVLRIKIPEILYSKARKSLSSVCEFFGHRTTAYIYIATHADKFSTRRLFPYWT